MAGIGVAGEVFAQYGGNVTPMREFVKDRSVTSA
jgi:hypothetical protein